MRGLAVIQSFLSKLCSNTTTSSNSIISSNRTSITNWLPKKRCYSIVCELPGLLALEALGNTSISRGSARNFFFFGSELSYCRRPNTIKIGRYLSVAANFRKLKKSLEALWFCYQQFINNHACLPWCGMKDKGRVQCENKKLTDVMLAEHIRTFLCQRNTLAK